MLAIGILAAGTVGLGFAVTLPASAADAPTTTREYEAATDPSIVQADADEFCAEYGMSALPVGGPESKQRPGGEEGDFLDVYTFTCDPEKPATSTPPVTEAPLSGIDVKTELGFNPGTARSVVDDEAARFCGGRDLAVASIVFIEERDGLDIYSVTCG
jgi:hypothetical protein